MDVVSRTIPCTAININTAGVTELSTMLHPFPAHTKSYLIKFPLKSCDLFGVRKGDIQTGRDCVDELNTVILSC